jgi:hypothetical protein
MGTDRRITGFGDGVGEDFAVTDEQVVLILLKS